jgi:hypothetical protein
VTRLQEVCAEELCQAVQLASDKIYDAFSQREREGKGTGKGYVVREIGTKGQGNGK